MVPLSQLDGMTAEEIGEAVIGLVDDARITDFFEQLTRSPLLYRLLPPLGADGGQSMALKNLCTMLGSTSKEISYLIERFKLLERTQHKDIELHEKYDQLCKVLDGALHFLQTKKSKLTPGQGRAMAVILELRNGCRICGYLDGRHADHCLKTHPLK